MEKLSYLCCRFVACLFIQQWYLHLDVGRDKSVQALEKAMVDDHIIFLTTQKDLSIDVPVEEDLYHMGTLTKVKQMLKLA